MRLGVKEWTVPEQAKVDLKRAEEWQVISDVKSGEWDGGGSWEWRDSDDCEDLWW